MPPFLVRMVVVVDAATAGEAVKQATQGKFRCVLSAPEVQAHGQFCHDRDCHLGDTMHGTFECKTPEWWRGIYPPPGQKPHLPFGYRIAHESELRQPEKAAKKKGRSK